MIVKPETMTFADKKIRMLIAGFPGIGKTTLALSAPKPLYIDVDLSAERVSRDTLNMAVGVTQPKDYDELRKDLGMDASDLELMSVKASLADYETIVIDTGAKLQTIMSQYGKQKNPKYGQSDGSLSLKGYGWLGRECQALMDHCIYTLNKHIVIIFHAVEEKDGDDTKLRIKAEGSFKNSVWDFIDLGGFMEIRGGKRTIGFDNCERYFAKGTRGIHGVWTIPELKPETQNNFITKLFDQYKATLEKELAEAAEGRAKYDAAMAKAREIISGLTNADSVNAASAEFKAIEHALTSKRESGNMWNAKTAQLGLIYDKVLGKYTPKEKEAE